MTLPLRRTTIHHTTKELEPQGMHDATIAKGTRVTGDARVTLLADLTYKYLDLAMTIREIAEKTGRGYGTVHRMLSDAGVLRSKGGKPRQPTGPQ